MSGYRGAGRLDKRGHVLALREAGGVWTWEPVREIWAKAEYSQKLNLFSRSGVGARDVALVIWRQSLSLHHAIELEGTHLFLTSITERNRNQLDVHAAAVELHTCTDKSAGTTFPAVLTEKYVRFDEPGPHATNAINCVLVTPKEILLKPGKLVEIDGIPCPIRTAHLLDPFKHEYEIERRVDL